MMHLINQKNMVCNVGHFIRSTVTVLITQQREGHQTLMLNNKITL